MSEDSGVVLEDFDYDLLRRDVTKLKSTLGWTFAEVGDYCGCHMQSVYKFVSGEYPRVGHKLRMRFMWFVFDHWKVLFPTSDPAMTFSKPRYAIVMKQPRLPGF